MPVRVALTPARCEACSLDLLGDQCDLDGLFCGVSEFGVSALGLSFQRGFYRVLGLGV